MNFIAMLYRKTDGRYWWLLALFTLLGGIIGILPILIALYLNPSLELNKNTDIVMGLVAMGWRFGFLPSLLTWSVLFVLGLRRSFRSTIIIIITGAITSMLTGWLLYGLSFHQGLLAGLCAVVATLLLSVFLPKPKRK